ncbi:MAG: Type-1 restriction enzyme EcoKI specificity protein [Syntrophorhabdus sp. PtaU1.Bin050]|nr:MAG: Type-1 restriction enzyme EcoKI specificity protein [Syntrophorhabdus sp. PtaU1.Bin050]
MREEQLTAISRQPSATEKESLALPEGWATCTLIDVSEGENAIVDGPFGSNLKNSDYVEDSINGVPVLTTKNLEGDYSDQTVRFISKEKFERLKRSQVNPGDILVAKIGSIGKTGIYPKRGRTAIIPANLLKFTVSKEIVFKYVYYYINSLGFQNKIKAISTATAQPAFNVTKFRLLEIPFPPLTEQHRIVAKIEELFSSLDKGVESLKTAQQQLKVHRQAVLKRAFEGKLTNGNVADGELPKEWKWITIREVAFSMKNGIYKPPNVYSSKGAACLRMYYNIGDGKILWFNVKRMNLNEKDIKEYELLEGDLLVNRVNSRELVGKTAYVTSFDESVVYESKNIRLRLKEVCSGKYLNYWFLLSANKYFTSNAQQTVGMASINQKQLGDFKFPIPPTIQEQNRIVSEIESRLSVCDKIEETINNALKEAESLRQSILKKAFEGKLVSQDPNDEPASILLDRIRKERAKTLPSKTRKRGRK